MADAKSRAEWDRASALMCLTANIHRDPKKGRPLKPQDFNPHSLPQVIKQVPTKDAMQVLKQVFVKEKS